MNEVLFHDIPAYLLDLFYYVTGKRTRWVRLIFIFSMETLVERESDWMLLLVTITGPALCESQPSIFLSGILHNTPVAIH